MFLHQGANGRSGGAGVHAHSLGLRALLQAEYSRFVRKRGAWEPAGAGPWGIAGVEGEQGPRPLTFSRPSLLRILARVADVDNRSAGRNG